MVVLRWFITITLVVLWWFITITLVVLWWFITIGRLVTISASAVWFTAIGTTIRSWTMDSLYLRIYSMLVFEVFIFAILQVPINFDGEPIRFVIVLKGSVLVYFL